MAFQLDYAFLDYTEKWRIMLAIISTCSMTGHFTSIISGEPHNIFYASQHRLFICNCDQSTLWVNCLLSLLYRSSQGLLVSSYFFHDDENAQKLSLKNFNHDGAILTSYIYFIHDVVSVKRFHQFARNPCLACFILMRWKTWMRKSRKCWNALPIHKHVLYSIQDSEEV